MTIDNTNNNKISIALWLYSVAPPPHPPPSHSLFPYQKKHKITGSFSAKLKCHEMVPPSFTLSLPLPKETQNYWFIFCKMKVP